MARARLSEQARADILAITATITAELDDPDDATPERFKSAVRRLLDQLKVFPLSGPPYPTNNPHLTGLRKVNLGRRFRNYLMFYLVADDEVLVLRVLHGARDIPDVLADSSDGENDGH